MTRYLLACAWAVALVGSFAGWGAVAGRALLGRREGDLGERTAWGIALTVALGGLANLLRLISPAALIGYAAVGLALFVVDAAARLLGPEDDPASPPPRLGLAGWAVVVVIVGLALFRVASSAYTLRFSQLDDHTGYLVFPVQMLETGGLTRDPFFARRVESGLGGGYLLNAFSTAAFAEEHSKLVDLGTGLLAMLAGAIGLARSRRTVGETWIVPALVLAINGVPHGNLTLQLIPAALLLGIHRTLSLDERSPGRAAMLGLLTAALVSLKSTLMPIAFFVFAIDFLPRIGRRATWKALPIEVAVGLICLAPWMIDLKRSSGTFLFPVLGKGVHGSANGTTYFIPGARDDLGLVRRLAFEVAVDPFVFATAVTALAALITWCGRRPEGEGRRRPEDLAFILAPLPILAMMIVMFAAEAPIRRYSYPLMLASLAVSLTTILRRTGDPAIDARRTVLGLICAAFFIGARWADTRWFYQMASFNVRAGLRGLPYVPPSDRLAYAAMQAAVPEGEPILAHLKQMYILDFRRNRIYVADWPGGASPPPGIPSFKGPEPLADYLTGQGIRYVAYSYADQANFPDRNRTITDPWELIANTHGYDFQDSLAALMTTRKLAYRDPALVVIDLATRVGPGDAPATPPETRTPSR